MGHLAIVCLLLDSEKFYTTPEEEEVDNDIIFNTPSSEPVNDASALVQPQTPHPPQHKCCSPSIDSETCTCSDEVSIWRSSSQSELTLMILICS